MANAISLSEGHYDGERFSSAAKALFGNIRQRFFASGNRTEPSLTYTPMGQCGLTRITSPAHGVAAQKTVRQLSDPDHIKVLVQVRGATSFHMGQDRFRISPNAAVIYDPTRPYYLVNATAVEQLILQIPRGDLGDRNLRALSRPVFLEDVGPGQFRTLSAFVSAASESAESLSYEMRAGIGQSLCSFANGLVGNHFQTDMLDHLERGSLILLRGRVLDFLARNLSDPDITIDRIAVKMGCSVRYLHRAFESQDLTLQKLVWKMRLDRSKAMLATQKPATSSVSDIAIRCGFSSSSHFSRTFREAFGLSPKQARSVQLPPTDR